MITDDPPTPVEWDQYRTLAGERAGRVGVLLATLAKGRSDDAAQMHELADALSVPGGICSAVVPAIPLLLGIAEKAKPARQTKLLSFVRGFAEEVENPNLESLMAGAGSKVEPFAALSFLTDNVRSQIARGAPLYLRILSGVRDARRTSDLHVLAADLLSRVPGSESGVLALYREAVAKEERKMHQALLIVAARRLAAGMHEWKGLLLEWSRNRSAVIPRFLASCFLMTEAGEETGEVITAFNESIEASAQLSLETIIAKAPAESRRLIYKLLVGSPRLPYPDAVAEYVFELLRSTFNDAVSYTGVAFSTTASGEKVVDYRLVGPKAPPARSLTPLQRDALMVVAANEAIWKKRLNFWVYFGLPNSREELRQLIRPK